MPTLRHMFCCVVLSTCLFAPHPSQAKDTTTAEVGDAIHALITTMTCGDVFTIYEAIKTPDTASSHQIISIMALTLYLNGFAQARNVEVAELNYSFGEFCVNNGESRITEFDG